MHDAKRAVHLGECVSQSPHPLHGDDRPRTRTLAGTNFGEKRLLVDACHPIEHNYPAVTLPLKVEHLGKVVAALSHALQHAELPQ